MGEAKAKRERKEQLKREYEENQKRLEKEQADMRRNLVLALAVSGRYDAKEIVEKAYDVAKELYRCQQEDLWSKYVTESRK